MNDTASLLHRAAVALAAECDHAQSRDGAGFNKFDASFGRQIASTPSYLWSADFISSAYRTLGRYRKQIAALTGIRFEELDPPVASNGSSRIIGWNKGRIFIKFPYDEIILNRIKRIFSPGVCQRSYDGETKTWFITPTKELAARLIENKDDWAWLNEMFPISNSAMAVLLDMSAEVNLEPAPKIVLENPSRSVRVSDGHLIFKFEFNPSLSEMMKQLPAPDGKRRWNSTEKEWNVAVPSSEHADRMAKLIVAYEFFGPEVIDWLTKKKQAFIENANTSALESAEPLDIEGLRGQPRPFQWVGIRQSMKEKRVIIGDEMGLGKTIQALVSVFAMRAFPCWIVVPATLKDNWALEIRKWLPRDLRVKVVTSNRDTDFEGYQFIICNYEQLPVGWQKKGTVELSPMAKAIHALGVQSMIFDEAHYLKSGKKSQRGAACLAVAKDVPVVLPLTGTPVLNRPIELIPLLELTGRLADFGGWYQYVNTYCNGGVNGFGSSYNGAANTAKLNSRLRETGAYIRRVKKNVMKELPPVVMAEQSAELTNRKQYEEAEADLIGYLSEQAEKDKSFQESIANLGPEEKDKAVRVRRSSTEIKVYKAQALMRLNTLRVLAGSGKIKAAVDWVNNFFESGGEKLVIAAHHKEVVRGIAKALGTTAIIDGATKIEDRQAVVDRFQNDPKCNIIVLSIMAAGVGITLTAASDILLTELPWRPADIDQMVARIHRIGQESDSVTSWMLLARGTIEDEVYALINEKRKVVNEVTDGDPGEVSMSLIDELAEALLRKTKKIAY